MSRRVLCLGGSTTIGVRSTRGWPEHLQQSLVGKALVHNAGHQGDRLVDVLRRIPEMLPMMRHQTIIVQMPLHDARGGGLPPAEMGILLQQVISWCQEAEPMLLCLASPTPILNTGAPVLGFGRPSRRWLLKAARVVEEVAAENELLFLPFHELPVEGMLDQVHPGKLGYAWLGTMTSDRLLPAWGALGRG